jgi:hypothetical protein
MKVVYLPTLKTNACNLHLGAAVGFDLQCAETLVDICGEVVFYLDEAQLDGYKKTIKKLASKIGVKAESSFEKAIKGTSCAVGDFSNYLFAYMLATKNPAINYLPIYTSADLGGSDKMIAMMSASGMIAISKQELISCIDRIEQQKQISATNIEKFLRGNII